MASPKSNQHPQDWWTQKWNLIFGQKIHPLTEPWLIGTFGNENGIGEDVIIQLGKKENLRIERNQKNAGLIPNFKDLALSEGDFKQIDPKIIDFYQNTSNYVLELKVKWNPFFKPFGFLVNTLFSRRINQLNIPFSNTPTNAAIRSEIIQLVDSSTHEVKYTFWLRKFVETGQVIYSGIYGLCQLPSGKRCVKAVFPLPNGNATVILNPLVNHEGNFVLQSKGRKFGDAGFYFLVEDQQSQLWAQYLPSFSDTLTLASSKDKISAIQVLKLWGLKVLQFDYDIKLKESH